MFRVLIYVRWSTQRFFEPGYLHYRGYSCAFFPLIIITPGCDLAFGLDVGEAP